MACEFLPPSEPGIQCGGFTIKLTDEFKNHVDNVVERARQGPSGHSKRARRALQAQPFAKIKLGRNTAPSYIMMGEKQFNIRKNSEGNCDMCMQTSNPTRFIQIGPINRKLNILQKMTDEKRKYQKKKTQNYIDQASRSRTERLTTNGRPKSNKSRPRSYVSRQHEPRHKQPRMGIHIRIIHLLFLEPLSHEKIKEKLDLTENVASMAQKKVEQVAEFIMDGGSGKYKLKQDQYHKIDPEFKDYSPSEKEIVRKKLQEYNKQKSTRKTPPTNASPARWGETSGRRPRGSLIPPKSRVPKSDKGTKTRERAANMINPHAKTRSKSSHHPTMNGSSSRNKPQHSNPQTTMHNGHTTTNKPGTHVSIKDIEKDYPELTEYNDYQTYKTAFEERYKEYEEIKRKLMENSETFSQMADQLKVVQKSKNRQKEAKLKAEIRDRYQKVHKKVDEMKINYNLLHQILKVLKKRVGDYVNKMKVTNSYR